MNQKEILWLASWYPNEKNPVAGDFIQRHARAVSAFRKLTVIYVDQSGWGEDSAVNKETIQTEGQLTEIRSFFHFKRSGFDFIDRIRYNLTYLLHYKQLLRKYFAEYGLPDLIHVHVPMKAGKLSLWAKRKFGIRYILSEQASTYLPEAPDFFKSRSLYYQLTTKKIFREASLVSNVSAAVAGILEKTTGIHDIRIVHNTVDESLFHYRASQTGTFRFIHVSSLSEQKNIPGMLRSFRKLSALRRDWELRLIGPVPADLVPLIEEMKMHFNLSCGGEVSYALVAREMQESSAFVLFSNHENFPCVIVEALCCGLPVICSDAGGSAEAIHQGNGIVVPKMDDQKLIRALNTLMDHYTDYDPKAISAEAISKYSYPVIGKQFATLYDEIKKMQTSL